MTAVTLAFGSACGDDNGSGKMPDQDTSPARIMDLAVDYCSAYADCFPEEFSQYFEDQPDCVAQLKQDLNQYSDSYSDDCADAVFDLFECTNKLSCDEEVDARCAEPQEAVETACASEMDGAAKQKGSARLGPGFRIPR